MVTDVIHTKSGASCKIHEVGATIVSFVSANGRENLFVSKDAVLDGTKAIRGGIPLCFPIFGPPPSSHHESTMPQHGFARLASEWKTSDAYDKEDAAGITMTLSLQDVTKGRGEKNPWAMEQAKLDGTDCELVYEIRVQPSQLTCTLIVKNTGTAAFDFQCLFHTYYKVDNGAAQDPSKTLVMGLGGYAITDKVTKDSGHVQSYDEHVVLDHQEVDRVYIHPDNHPTVHAKIAVGNGLEEEGKLIKLEAAGQVDEMPVPASCVVWNPYKDKAAAMSDFGDEQYHDMICVEPGLIGHQPLLEPGQSARLSQSIIV